MTNWSLDLVSGYIYGVELVNLFEAPIGTWS